QISRQACLKDEQLLLWNLVEGRLRHIEVFRKDFLRRMREPVRYQECMKLIKVSVVEYEEESATIRAEALNRMRNAWREEPKVALAHIAHKALALLIHCCDACVAVEHDG